MADYGGMGHNDDPNDPHNSFMQDMKILTVKLTCSKAMVRMYIVGYEGLLFHGINFRELPAYKDPKGYLLIAVDPSKSIEAGQNAMLEYCKQVESDIRAAIARKRWNVTHMDKKD